MPTLNQLIRHGREEKRRTDRTRASDQCPQKQGVRPRVSTRTPKKPNSAPRKIAKVRLSNRHDIFAHIPGEGHNSQEHSMVLIRGGRVKDLPAMAFAQTYLIRKIRRLYLAVSLPKEGSPVSKALDIDVRTGFYLMMLLLRSFGRARSSLVFYVWLALLDLEELVGLKGCFPTRPEDLRCQLLSPLTQSSLEEENEIRTTALVVIASDDMMGQSFASLVSTVAAAESAIGLAIFVITFRVRGTIAVEFINSIQGSGPFSLGERIRLIRKSFPKPLPVQLLKDR
ncbi:hypothetical protein JHK86_057271 (mitochondrion) [Glycine max]|nr:hypothetical protein JHK86_057264 [Glycine max]KAG4906024.1 hypothetical protein JHK86_057271 [Glycine max]